jgi:A118 family predicted phage portal protein
MEKMMSNIKKWNKIYSGRPDWSDYKVTTIGGVGRYKRKKLNMAKTICDKISKLLWSEYPIITVDEGLDILNEVFNNNMFYTRMSDSIEYQAALGGMVIKGYANNNKIELDFITADKFIPIDWDGYKITGGKFYDYIKRDKTLYTKIETHRFVDEPVGENDDGDIIKKRVYKITNELYKDGNKKNLDIKVLFPDLDNEYIIEGVDNPLFVYIKNPIANNVDINSPLGISIFDSCIDSLESVDICYDGLNDEILLGKKRIIVSTDNIKTVIDPDTNQKRRYFDPADRVYVAIDIDDVNKLKITDNSSELRVDDVVKALTTHLDIIAVKCGLSAGTFSFDGKSVKTATEIVSENSETFTTKKKYQACLQVGIKEIVRIIFDIYNIINKDSIDCGKINITWFDSLFDSDDDKFNKYLKLSDKGLVSKRMVLKSLFGLIDNEINEIFKEIENEKVIT